MILSFIVFFLIFSILVLIHELGHFVMARKSGVSVDEFGFGYPPKIFGRRVGKTEYSINLIPFGGFVRIPGSDYEEPSCADRRNKGNFANQSPKVKLVILLGGIFMNLALAVVLYYAVFALRNFTSLPLFLFSDFNFKYGTVNKIENVIMYTQNSNSKFEAGDEIVSISYDDSTVYPKTLDAVVNFIADKKDTSLTFNVENIQTGEKRQVRARTYFDESLNRYVVGIGLGEAATISYNGILEKVFAPFLQGANVLMYSSSIFGSLINSSVETGSVKPVAESLTGPVGIFFIVEAILKMGGSFVFVSLLDFTALLSLSLAFMNILPIPGLDGGHLVFVLYEWVFKRRLPLKVMRYTSSIGMYALIVLAVLVAFKDFFMFR